jgi:hypothetical protein
MFNDKRASLLLAAALLCTTNVLAQITPQTSTSHRTIHLDVVVTDSSGRWVTDLQQSDFKVLDNHSPQIISSFKSVLLKPQLEPQPAMVSPLAKVASVRGAAQGGHGELFEYKLAFEAPTPQKPNEFHQIVVTVDRPNLEVRTRHGYFARP